MAQRGSVGQGHGRLPQPKHLLRIAELIIPKGQRGVHLLQERVKTGGRIQYGKDEGKREVLRSVGKGESRLSVRQWTVGRIKACLKKWGKILPYNID